MDSFSLLNSPREKMELLKVSLTSRRLLLSREDFNSLADYLLVRKYIRKVEDFYEKEGYIIAKIAHKIPMRYGNMWRDYEVLYEKNGTQIVKVDRYIVFGLDENGKIVTFYSDGDLSNVDNIRLYIFGFKYDFSSVEFIDLRDIEDSAFSCRVQGDIILNIDKCSNVEHIYKVNLAFDSASQLRRVLDNEILLRILDILGELGISGSIEDGSVVVEGGYRGIKEKKLFRYILKNIPFSDIFPGYKMVIEEGDWATTCRFLNDTNSFSFSLSAFVNRVPYTNSDSELVINISSQPGAGSIDSPYTLFGKMIAESIEVEEIEIKERIGRHIITIESAFPRNIIVDYQFPMSGRRYAITLSVRHYYTSGTKVTLEHVEHGRRTVMLPCCAFAFSHVRDIYRTIAIKNKLLLEYYFK